MSYMIRLRAVELAVESLAVNKKAIKSIPSRPHDEIHGCCGSWHSTPRGRTSLPLSLGRISNVSHGVSSSTRGFTFSYFL